MPISFLLGASAVSVYLAHFSIRVHNGFAWLTIAFNGLLMILFFAGLHRATGVLCTAPVCPASRTVVIENVTTLLDSTLQTAFYFSMVTFTTLGYGDFQPHPDMRLVASFEAVLGYVYLGLTVGSAIDLGNQRTSNIAHKRAGTVFRKRMLRLNRRLRRKQPSPRR